jgi:hypothetical protein
LVGRLELDLPEVAVGAGRRAELLAAFAARVAGGFDHARLEASLRTSATRLEGMNRELARSRTQLLAAKDLGRRRVAVRIKSEVVDRLRSVLARLQRVEDEARTDPTAATGEVDAALAAVTVAIEQLRQITSTVYSRRLTEEGLARALAAEVWPDLTLHVLGAPRRWPAAVELTLYACCVDLMQVLHGPVTVELAETADSGTAELNLRCAAMPDPEDWLSSTRERMDILGGEVERRSRDQLVVRLPLLGPDPLTDLSPGPDALPALAIPAAMAPEA